MTEPARTFVKWTVALLVLAGVVVYALQNVGPAFRTGLAFGDEASEGAGTGPTGPVADGNAAAQADLSIATGTVGGVGAPQLTIGPGPGDAALLVFPLIAGSPDCVATASLEVAIESATPATELGVYASGQFDTSVLADATVVQGEVVLDRTSPPLQFTDGTPGRLTFDVTQLYRTWASGQPFANGQQVPPETPFTVVVRATDEGAVGRAIVMTASEAGDAGPRLLWTGTPGCGAEAPPTAAPA